MRKVWLNDYGRELYPHLANEWLDVYGFDPVAKAFVVWDKVVNEWVSIGLHFCEGEGA